MLEKFSKYDLFEKEQILFTFALKNHCLFILFLHIIYPIYSIFILSYELFVYKNVQRGIKFIEKINL